MPSWWAHGLTNAVAFAPVALILIWIAASVPQIGWALLHAAIHPTIWNPRSILSTVCY